METSTKGRKPTYLDAIRILDRLASEEAEKVKKHPKKRFRHQGQSWLNRRRRKGLAS